MTESPYAFRRYLETVHRPDRRDPSAVASAGEVTIDETWTIAIRRDAPPLIHNVARDLQDYVLVSMQTSLRLQIVDDIAEAPEPVIVIGLVDDPAGLDGVPKSARSYRLVVETGRITICGRDARGAALLLPRGSAEPATGAVHRAA